MADYTLELSYLPQIVAGIDEAGRGPLAGPVYAAAVIIDNSKILSTINDSKLLSAKQRDAMYQFITENYAYGIGQASAAEIDQFNILNASKLACIRAFEQLSFTHQVDIVLVDGNMQFSQPNFKSIIKGDQKSLSIAAASIIAKVTRDRVMVDLSTEYPVYNWSQNKGYPTKDHAAAINQYGSSVHHRKSFKVPQY